MNSDNEHFNSLIKLLLPPEMFQYFEITELQSTDREVHVFLDEQNVVPQEYTKDQLVTKGFHKSATIQDFPLRDKAMFLHVRRRRWMEISTGKMISRNWNAVANGTRLTKEFATFLKELSGHLSNQQQQS